MAWPITARLTDYIANVTTITAVTLNAIQDAVWRLIGGYRSIVKMTVDGTGDVDVSANPAGQLRIGGAASDTTARLKFTDVPVDFITISESPATGGAFVRTFAGTNGAANVVARTVNAKWTGTQWDRDVAGDATLEFISGAATWQVMYYAAAGGAPWNTAAWVVLVNVASPGLLTAATGVTATAGNITAAAATGDVIAGRALEAQTTISATATPTTAITPGRVYEDSTVVAWCRIDVAGGARTFVRGFNIASSTYNGAGDVTVEIGQGVANTAVCAVTVLDDAGGIGSVRATGTDTNTIRVLTFSAIGVAADRNFYLVMFGG